MRRRERSARRFSQTVGWSGSLGVALVIGAWGWSTPGVEADAAIRGSGTSLTGMTPKPIDSARRYARAFRISGNVQGLYPGASLPLDLVISNKLSKSIVVTSVNTTVTSTSHSCPATDVVVASYVGQLNVAAHRSATVNVNVVMAHSAPNSCQGAKFAFAYHGLGRTT